MSKVGSSSCDAKASQNRASARRARSCAVLDTAVRDGAMATNPAAAVRRPEVTSKEASHLTPAQVTELLKEAQRSRYVRSLLQDDASSPGPRSWPGRAHTGSCSNWTMCS